MPKTQHWCNLRGTSVENSLHSGMRMAVLVPKMHPIPYSVYLAPVGCTKMIHYRYCVEVEKKRSRLSKSNDSPYPQLEIRAAPRPLPSFRTRAKNLFSGGKVVTWPTKSPFATAGEGGSRRGGEEAPVRVRPSSAPAAHPAVRPDQRTHPSSQNSLWDKLACNINELYN